MTETMSLKLSCWAGLLASTLCTQAAIASDQPNGAAVTPDTQTLVDGATADPLTPEIPPSDSSVADPTADTNMLGMPLNLSIDTEQAGEWVDDQHSTIREYLHHQALRLDQMFGNTATKQPRAQVRLLLDNSWDKYNEFDTRVRIRGSLRLPNATKRLRLVFGDDTLEEEQSVGVPLGQDSKANGTPTGQAKTNPNLRDINDQALKDNASIALRWLGSMRHGIRADYDLGVRSGTDIYARTEAGKTWQLDADSRALLDQTLRYGIESKLYARTDLELQYRPQHADPLFYHAALTYAEEDSERGWSWTHRISQQHAFADQQVLSYGISVAGWMRGQELQMDSYGPWVSYRQPFLRDWLFVRGDVNFFNDRPEHRDHYLSGFLRVEAVF